MLLPNFNCLAGWATRSAIAVDEQGEQELEYEQKQWEVEDNEEVKEEDEEEEDEETDGGVEEEGRRKRKEKEWVTMTKSKRQRRGMRSGSKERTTWTQARGGRKEGGNYEEAVEQAEKERAWGGGRIRGSSFPLIIDEMVPSNLLF